MAKRTNTRSRTRLEPRRRQAQALEPLELLPTTRPATAWQRWGPIALGACLVFICYFPCLDNGFVSWDDDHYIFDNRQVSEPDGLKSIWGDMLWYSDPRFQRSTDKRVSHQYYPLIFTIYWLEFRLFGGDDTTPVETSLKVDGKMVPVTRSMTIQENVDAGNMSATGFHATSMIMQAVVVMLLILCARALGFSNWVAWAAAILFAIHPLQAATVVWAAERKNIISLAFYLLSMMSYVKMRRCAPDRTARQVLLYVLALVLFQAALFSKTVSLTLPVMIFFTDRLLERQSRPHIIFASSMIFLFVLTALTFVLPMRPAEAAFDAETIGFVTIVVVMGGLIVGLTLLSWPPRLVLRSILRVLPFIVLAAIAAYITIEVEDRQRTIPITDAQRPLIAGAVAWFYALKMLVPIGLCPVYGLWKPDNADLLWYMPLLAAIMAGFAVIILRKRISPHFRWAVLFYAVTIIPMSGFKNINYFQFAFVAEHYFYHGAVGLFLILALTVHWLAGRVFSPQRGRKVATAFICLAVLAFGIRTFTYCNVWQTADSFWQRTIKMNDECWPAYYNTANARTRDARKTDDPEEKEALYEEAVALYIKVTNINTRITEPFNALIRTRLAQKKYPEALDAYQAAATRFPHIVKYNTDAARLAERIGDTERSIYNYRAAAAKQKKYGDRHVRKGRYCRAYKSYAKAYSYIRKALAQNSDDQELRELLDTLREKHDQAKPLCREKEGAQ